MQRAIKKRVVLIPVLFLLLVGTTPRLAQAQSAPRVDEFWPEIDIYIHLKPTVRLFLLGTVSQSIENGKFRNAQGYEAQVGAHVDYIPNDHLILRTGYRYGTAIGSNDNEFKEHRLLTEQTFRKLLPGDVLLSDRNREDFRFIRGDFSFRYRNRLMLQREFHLPKFMPGFLLERSITPYVSGEIYYDTRFNTWNRNRLTVGVRQSLKRGPLRKMLLPKRQVVLDIYWTKQNDSRAENQHVRAVGTALSFYF